MSVRDLTGINPSIPPPQHDDSSTEPKRQGTGDSYETKLPELPPAPPSHQFGGGYSSNRPVPTVQNYREEQKKFQEEADEYAAIVEKRHKEAEARRERALQGQADGEAKEEETGGNGETEHEYALETAGEKVDEGDKGTNKNVVKSAKDKKDKVLPSGPANEKQRMMDQMNASKSESGVDRADAVRPTDRFNKAEHGSRRVRDPTTGGEIIIRDADPKGELRINPTDKTSTIPIPVPIPPIFSTTLSPHPPLRPSMDSCPSSAFCNSASRVVYSSYGSAWRLDPALSSLCGGAPSAAPLHSPSCRGSHSSRGGWKRSLNVCEWICTDSEARRIPLQPRKVWNG